MGIVAKQSFLNTLTLFLGFAIGGVNTLFLYTEFLNEDYFGLIVFLLSTSIILLPLVTLGVQHTIVKFYSSYAVKEEKDAFLISSLFVPLLVIIPMAFVGVLSYTSIALWLSSKNKIIENYVWVIFLLTIFMGYFEVFYAWSKVHLQSVFGHFIKEVFARLCIFLLLFAVYFKWIDNKQFIYAVVIVYGIRTLVMKLYAFYLCKPKIVFKLPKNKKEIFYFSMFMIVSGSAASILLEIDKTMISQLKEIAQVAYYAVAIYIAGVIAIPNRAMQQITTPLTAQKMNEENLLEVHKIYKESSINLLLVGGLLFLLINLNITDVYHLINKPQFLQGISVVLIISFAKMIELSLGTANAILLNSKYYKIYFYLSVLTALLAFLCNLWFIPILGIKGAAVATFLVVLVATISKVAYVYYRWKMIPFSGKLPQLLLIIGGIFFIFSYWNFSFHPLINIVLKSGLISILYLFTVHKVNISPFINKTINRYIK